MAYRRVFRSTARFWEKADTLGCAHSLKPTTAPRVPAKLLSGASGKRSTISETGEFCTALPGRHPYTLGTRVYPDIGNQRLVALTRSTEGWGGHSKRESR
jgi:hypothetical protein